MSHAAGNRTQLKSYSVVRIVKRGSNHDIVKFASSSGHRGEIFSLYPSILVLKKGLKSQSLTLTYLIFMFYPGDRQPSSHDGTPTFQEGSQPTRYHERPTDGGCLGACHGQHKRRGDYALCCGGAAQSVASQSWFVVHLQERRYSGACETAKVKMMKKCWDAFVITTANTNVRLPGRCIICRITEWAVHFQSFSSTCETVDVI